MKAIKDNKVYSITETQKKFYLSSGYDIVDDSGEVLEYSHLKTIKYSDHLKALEEAKGGADSSVKIDELENTLKEKEAKIDELENATPEVPDSVMHLLQAYAKTKGIDTGSASTEAGVLNKIIEAEKV